MKKRLLALLLTVLLAFSAAALSVSAEEESVQEIVYTYLTQELGLCPAAAAGVMGNVQIECSFDPTAGAIDTNDLYSFGLMMWNGPRYESLKKWCAENGYSHEDPRGQLGYLKWELENTEKGAYRAILDIPNTIEGAARAAIVWASEFERCTRTSYGLRVFYALNTFWPDYAGGDVSNTPGIYGYYYNVPENIKYGESLTLYGAVVSYSSNIKSLTVGVFTEDGTLVTGRTIDQDNLVGNIGIVDRFVVFGKVPRGEYYYTVTAVNEDGDYIVERHSFTVSDEPTKSTLIPESEGGVICENGASCPGLEFSDMPPATSWKHSGIDYVLKAGLFAGKPGGVFSPDQDMSRAMFVTVMKRLFEKYDLQEAASDRPTDTDSDVTGDVSITTLETGSPEASGTETNMSGPTEALPTSAEPASETAIPVPEDMTPPPVLQALEDDPAVSTDNETSADTSTAELSSETDTDEPDEITFEDVPADAWYAEYVMWAAEAGLVEGKGEGVFAPDSSLTRAELATLFYRIAKKCGLDTEATAYFEEFADAEEVPEWAADALSWAVAEGLVAGSNDSGTLYLYPGGHASRAQVAAITERFASYIERQQDK